MKNAHRSFPRAQINFLLLLLSNQRLKKQKDSSFTVINDEENKQNFTYKKLEPARVSHFCLKNDFSSGFILLTSARIYFLSKQHVENRALKRVSWMYCDLRVWLHPKCFHLEYWFQQSERLSHRQWPDNFNVGGKKKKRQLDRKCQICQRSMGGKLRKPGAELFVPAGWDHPDVSNWEWF